MEIQKLWCERKFSRFTELECIQTIARCTTPSSLSKKTGVIRDTFGNLDWTLQRYLKKNNQDVSARLLNSSRTNIQEWTSPVMQSSTLMTASLGKNAKTVLLYIISNHLELVLNLGGFQLKSVTFSGEDQVQLERWWRINTRWWNDMVYKERSDFVKYLRIEVL